MDTVDFCMSQAPVGQRSAHNPQCTQMFSSFNITRPVCGNGPETYNGCVAFCRGDLSLSSISAAVPFGAIVRQHRADGGLLIPWPQVIGIALLNLAISFALFYLAFWILAIFGLTGIFRY